MSREDELDPHRVNPDGIDDELEKWQLLNWREERFDDGPRKIPKQPGDPDGDNARSNDASTWGSAADTITNATERDDLGLGFPCAQPGHPFVFLDIDIPDSGEWVPSFDRLGGCVVERSPSGNSRRVIFRDCEVPEWWTNQSDPGKGTREVKVFEDSGYVTLTGDVLKGFEPPLEPTHSAALERWLKEAWRAFNPDVEEGAEPWVDEADGPLEDRRSTTSRRSDGDTDTEEWLTEADVRDALDYIDPDLDHDEWVRIGIALADFFDRTTARELFVEWSKRGMKWDDEAKRRAPGIIDDTDSATGEDDVTIATLIDRAKRGGWDLSTCPSANAGRTAHASTDGGLTDTATSSGETDLKTGTGDEDDSAHLWGEVMGLFDATDDGSTTRGYDRAARALSVDHHFAARRDTGELYYYEPDRGYYVRKGRTYIEELLQQNIPGYVNSGRTKNVYEHVRARNYVDGETFTPPEGKVCVENGVLDLETRELEAHSPEYYFTSRLQTPYDPDATADRWEEFLEESTASTEVRKLEEFIGYCLEVWHHERDKNLFIVGPRQSGKSTFTETVQALFGPMPTVTNLTPQQIADTQFDAASLKEAALNAVNDINATKIQDTGTLKRVFSGERLKLERKYQDATFGAPNAKHLFSANWLPTVVGQDESLYRRVLIVEFPNSLDDDERDTTLKDTLRGELSGILNRALDARDRLHEQGGFTNDRSTDDTRRKWDSWLDAHKRFLYTQFQITGDEDDTVDKETYYQAYKEYCGRNGYELKAKQGVTKSLQWVPEIVVHDKGGYAGLAWRSEDAGDIEAGGGGGKKSKRKSESQQLGLGETSQDALATRTLRWIEAFSTPTAPASREDVLEFAEQQGEDRDRVANMIDTLADKGAIWKPENGGVRQS